ncbi:diadenylate cyclase [Priestia megaterium]|uniref:diadenylate cyclase n=1 Tax=Priestia megaterium TaxID=1404 RepID=UPI0015CF0600|nr:diadenylate cyclase [Priestia megaterium]
MGNLVKTTSQEGNGKGEDEEKMKVYFDPLRREGINKRIKSLSYNTLDDYIKHINFDEALLGYYDQTAKIVLNRMGLEVTPQISIVSVESRLQNDKVQLRLKNFLSAAFSSTKNIEKIINNNVSPLEKYNTHYSIGGYITEFVQEVLKTYAGEERNTIFSILDAIYFKEEAIDVTQIIYDLQNEKRPKTFIFIIVQLSNEDYTKYKQVKQNISKNVNFLDEVIYSLFSEYYQHERNYTEAAHFYHLSYDQLLRRAGKGIVLNLVNDVVRETLSPQQQIGRMFGQGTNYNINLYETLTIISSLKYEGSESGGKIIFCNENHLSIETIIKLKNNINIDDYGCVRKLLETSRDQLYLLCNGYHIYGLGKFKDIKVDEKKKLFSVEFIKNFHWDLHDIRNEKIMSVKYGEPALPKEKISIEEFSSVFETLFPEKDCSIIWSIIKRAIDQQHGTMLVITEAAEEEAFRLRKQSFRFDPPVFLDPSHVLSITNIDGALLLNPDGRHFAMGVILDGNANDKADISRGARYNSSVRYLERIKEEYNNEKKCLIVVVSEDGMINLQRL